MSEDRFKAMNQALEILQEELLMLRQTMQIEPDCPYTGEDVRAWMCHWATELYTRVDLLFNVSDSKN